MTAEILYTIPEVAQLWRCSRDHIYDLITRGRLKTVNIGQGRAKTRIRESVLNAFIRSNGDGTEPPAGPSQPSGPTGPGRKAK